MRARRRSYWRMIDGINRQRLWMADRLEEMHTANEEISFSAARAARGHRAHRARDAGVPALLAARRLRPVRSPSEHRRRSSSRCTARIAASRPPSTFFEQTRRASWFAALQPRRAAIGEMGDVSADERSTAIDNPSGGDSIEEPELLFSRSKSDVRSTVGRPPGCRRTHRLRSRRQRPQRVRRRHRRCLIIASATPARCPTRSRRRCRRATSSPAPCCRATATSRAASTRRSR